jgi:hypothetical protein
MVRIASMRWGTCQFLPVSAILVVSATANFDGSPFAHPGPVGPWRNTALESNLSEDIPKVVRLGGYLNHEADRQLITPEKLDFCEWTSVN